MRGGWGKEIKMTRDEAKRIIEKQSKIIEFIFGRAGNINPLFHYGGAKGQSVITTQFAGDDEKDAVVEVVRKVLKRERAEWVLYISEAWIVRLEPGEKMSVRPSEDLKRREEVVIYQLEYTPSDSILRVGGSVSSSYTCAEQKILRVGGKARLGLLEWAQEGSLTGRFSDLLPNVGRGRGRVH